MMYQGLFGLFPFTVDEKEVCTFRDFKTSHEMAYAEHKTLDGLPRLQHTGRNLDTASLTVIIVPLDMISTVEMRLRALNLMVKTGLELPLVIGLKYHGLHVLKSWEAVRKQIHFGVCLSAEVSLNLQEYN